MTHSVQELFQKRREKKTINDIHGDWYLKRSLALCCPLQAALKKYQMEHKSKGESLEKCQAELKKLRRKSQGSKHPSKYGDKEMQVSV